jgi:glycogen synthase
VTARLRIAFICNEYPPGRHGGIGTVVQALARGLAATGHEVRVIGMYPPQFAGREYEVDRGVRVWRFTEPRVRGGAILGRYRLFRRVAGWVRSGEIDLIEAPDWEGMTAGWPALPVPVVVRLNGSATYFASEMGRPVRRLTRFVERAALQRADFWCSVSRYTADRTRLLFKLADGPHAVLYNPVELVACSPGTQFSERRDVLFAGTLTAKKGIVPLIDAWPVVRQRCADARLHVCGKDGTTDGGTSMQAFLVSRLPEPVRDSVIFHGHVDRTTLLSRLGQARVAVFPSYSEAFALAPLEAMGCGCPTISTLRSSGPEMFEHGRHGLLVDPDHPEQIAAAITRVLTDEPFAQQLGEAGREHVRRTFSTDVLIQQNLAFYCECLERFGSAHANDPAGAGGPFDTISASAVKGSAPRG